MYTTSKITTVIFNSSEKQEALSKCKDAAERVEVLNQFDDQFKSFYLNGFWKEESVRNFIKRTRPNFKGKISCSHSVVNHSKMGMDYDKSEFEFTI